MFLEPFQDADVREAHGAAAFERDADFGAWLCWRGILLREHGQRDQKHEDRKSNSAHRGLLNSFSKSRNSRMNYEFGAGCRFQQARMKNSGTFVFLEDVAAVDDQNLSGDVGGLEGGEEANRGGDLVGRASAAEGGMKGGDFFGGGGGGGGDPAGRGAVDGDAVAGGFDGDGAHHAVHGGFRGAVRGGAGVADERPSHGGDIHDAAVLLVGHSGKNGAGHAKGGVQGDGDLVLPFGEGSFQERLAIGGLAG